MVGLDLETIQRTISLGAFAIVLALFWFGRRRDRPFVPRTRVAVAAIAVLVVAEELPRGLGHVQPGARGVLLRLGAPTGKIVPVGVYAVVPVLDTVVQVDTQTVTVAFDRAQGICRDLQPVAVDLSVTFHVDPDRVVSVWTQFRDAYAERIVRPSVSNALKTTVAQYDSAALVTHRGEMLKTLHATLADRLAQFGLVLDAVDTTHLQYSYAYAQASSDKVAAGQRALEARAELERVRYQSQQAVIRAESELRALKLQKNVDPKVLLAERRLDLQRRAIDKWDGHLPQTTTSMPFLGGLLGKPAD